MSGELEVREPSLSYVIGSMNSERGGDTVGRHVSAAANPELPRTSYLEICWRWRVSCCCISRRIQAPAISTHAKPKLKKH